MERHIPRQQRFTKQSVSGRGGVVAAQHGEAARVGADVLAAGGNAVDATVAVSFALGVVEPWMSGMGGGGFMVVRETSGDAHSLGFGMRAPARLDPSAYPLSEGIADGVFPWPNVKDDRNLVGPLSIAVPGLVDGIGAAHRRWGRMPWKSLLEPAVALAREGLCADWYATLVIGNAARRIAKDAESARWFLPGGFPPRLPTLPRRCQGSAIPALRTRLKRFASKAREASGRAMSVQPSRRMSSASGAGSGSTTSRGFARSAPGRSRFPAAAPRSMLRPVFPEVPRLRGPSAT